jgi:ferredoxin-NADP reductase
MSDHLATTRAVDPGLMLTGPFGEETIEPTDAGPVLLLSAGIGITPMVALLRELVDRSVSRPVSLLHVSRTADVALWDEVIGLVDRLPADPRRVSLHLTRETGLRCRELGARPGRPGPADIAGAVAQLPGEDLAVLVCGPDRFGADARSALRTAGVHEESIRQEVFYSPPAGDRPHNPPVSAGPFEVRFSRSGEQASWEPAKGSLLDLAESRGLTPPADCRLAACNICATAVPAGTTAYTIPPMVPPRDGGVLICCAVPTSDVTVDL